MASDSLQPLGEVAKVRSGFAFRGSDMGDHGVPIIKIKNITPPFVDTSDCDKVPETVIANLPDSDRYLLHEGDILIAMTGATTGKVGRFPKTETPYYLNQRVGKVYLTGPDRADYRYLYFLLSQSTFVQRMFGLADGSAQGNVSGSQIEKLRIPLPPLREQQAIASILSALESRIESNRQMSRTFWEIARAIFKSWFIEFDPVRAKAEGRSTGFSREVDDLFPADFDDSTLGRIPRGWNAGSFENFISQRNEHVDTREIVVLSAVASGKLVMSDDHFIKRVYSKETAKYLIVEQWDFAYNPSRINIGSIGMLEEQIVGGVSPVYVVFHPHPAYRWFLEFTLRRASTKAWINTLASGTVRQSLSYSDFASIPCVVPAEVVVQEFNRIWTILREGIISRDKISETLTTLRNTLLPKLLSGELQIPDVERILARCA